jgi:hypothetical protein
MQQMPIILLTFCFFLKNRLIMKYVIQLLFLGQVLLVSSCSNITNFTLNFRGDASLIISQKEFTLTEGESGESFNVSLASQPTDSVSITVTVSDGVEARVVPQSISFTPDDYSTPQTVTIYPLTDCVTDGNKNITIETSEISSADSAFDLSMNPELKVTINAEIIDNPAASPELFLQANHSIVETTEDGLIDKFIVALSCPPSQPVTVAVSSSNTSEGVLDTSSVVLDSTNYNIGALVTVTGQPDCTPEPDISYTITAGSTVSADPEFNNLEAKTIEAVNHNAYMLSGLLRLNSTVQLNRGLDSYNNFQVMLSCQPDTPVTMTASVTGLSTFYTLWSPLNGSHVFGTNNWATPADIIVQVLSDSYGDYSIDLTTDQPAAYPAMTINVADSGTKYIGFYVTGLEAGNSFTITNSDTGAVSEVSGNGYKQIFMAKGTSYNLSAGTVSGSGPFQNCLFTGGNPNGTLTANVVVADVVCSTSYYVSGTVTGLDTAGGNTFDITETNSSATFNVTGSSYYFLFADNYSYSLNIENFARGTGPEKTCKFDDSGTTGYASAISGSNVNLPITCTTTPFDININVTGLTSGETVILQNNGSSDLGITEPTTTGAYTLPDHSAYALSITGQPQGKVCAFTDAAQYGTIDSTIVNLNVNCVDGYSNGGQSVNTIPSAKLGYMLYRGSVTTVPNITTTNRKRGMAIFEDTLFYVDYADGSPGSSKIYKCTLPDCSSSIVVDATNKAFRQIVTDGTNLYVANATDRTVEKYSASVSSQSTPITTFNPGLTGTEYPSGLALDATRQILYVGIRNAQVIKRINLATGTIDSITTPTNKEQNEGMALIDNDLYVAQAAGGQHCILKVTDASTASSSSGSLGTCGYGGFQDGPLAIAKFFNPHGIATDGTDLYVAEYDGRRVRRINLKKNTVSTIAGSGTLGTGTGGAADSFGQLNYIVTDGRKLYVASGENNLIRQITDSGLVGYWPLVGNALDYGSDGVTNNGTLGDGTTTTTYPTAATGRFDDPATSGVNEDPSGAYSFDGGDYISATAPITDVSACDVTLSTWFKYGGQTSNQIIAYNGNTGSSGFGLMYRNGYGLSLLFGGSGNGYGTIPFTPNTTDWIHFTMTCTNTNQWKVHINGKQVYQGIHSPTNSTPTGFYIGYNGTDQNYTGSIADVRIYNRALNEGEINELAQDADPAQVGSSYNTGATGLLSHYSFDSDGGSPATPLLADAGALGYALNKGTEGAGSDIGKDGDDTGSYYFIRTNATSGQNLKSSNITTEGIGAGQNMTISAWVKPKSLPPVVGNIYVIASRQKTTGEGYYLVLFKNSTNQVIYWSPMGGGNNNAISNIALPINTWSHIAVIQTGISPVIYVNGKALETTIGGSPGFVPETSATPFYIGKRYDGQHFFDGAIDDVRIYNNALTADQIRQLAVQVPNGLVARYDFTDNDGTPDTDELTDVSGWGATLSNSSATHSADGGRFGTGDGAYTFDGSTSKLTNTDTITARPIGNSPRTMCAWYKPDDYPSTNGDQYPIVDQGSGTLSNGKGHILVIRYINGNLDLTSGFWNGSDTVHTYGMYSPQSWQFVCGTWDPADTSNVYSRLYLNGYEIKNNNVSISHSTTSDLSIGKGNKAELYFKGAIDDVRIYNRALSATEIQALVQQPNKRIWVTANTYTGDLRTDSTGTGIAGADDKCMADSNYPSSGTYKAMIVDGTNRQACTTENCTTGITQHTDWVLRPNVTYIRPDASVPPVMLPIFTANWNGVFDYSAAPGAGYSPLATTAFYFYTGLSMDWTTNTNVCNGGSGPWTDGTSSNNGARGDASKTVNDSTSPFTGPWGSTDGDGCTGLYLACVEQ